MTADPSITYRPRNVCQPRANPREDDQALFRRLPGSANELILKNIPLCITNADVYIATHRQAGSHRDDLIAEGLFWLTAFVRRLQFGELTINDANITGYLITGLRRHVQTAGRKRYLIVAPRGVKPVRVLQGELAMQQVNAIPAPDLIAQVDSLDLVASCCRSLLEYQIVLARLARYTWEEIGRRLHVPLSTARLKLERIRERYTRRMKAILE